MKTYVHKGFVISWLIVVVMAIVIGAVIIILLAPDFISNAGAALSNLLDLKI